MSDTHSTGALGAVRAVAGTAPSPVHAAIAQAAEATGVDFGYLLAQARLESSLDPKARAATSSAAGLYQFTGSTWLDTLGRHAADHGLSWVSDAIQGGGMADPQTRAQVMSLRFDPQMSALMAAELASDNRDALSAQLGRDPDAAELYLAHFLGAAGAGQFLSALADDPTQSAAAILPKAAAANRGIFYAGGAARSVAGVMDLMRAKMARAMDGADMDASGVGAGSGLAQSSPLAPSITYENVATEGWEPAMGPIAREFHTDRSVSSVGGSAPTALPPVAARSMADTLQATFGGTGGTAPAHVRAVYLKLSGFGL